MGRPLNMARYLNRAMTLNEVAMRLNEGAMKLNAVPKETNLRYWLQCQYIYTFPQLSLSEFPIEMFQLHENIFMQIELETFM